jgi:hypothetical protein
MKTQEESCSEEEYSSEDGKNKIESLRNEKEGIVERGTTVWVQCIGEIPHKPNTSNATSQFEFAKNLFNKHESTGSHDLFYCRYQRQKCCKARLKFVKVSNKWYFKGVHSHPDHYILSRVRSSKPQFGDLSQERQQQLRDLVITKKRMKSAKDICVELNNGYDSDNLSCYVFPEQVLQAKEKFVYSSVIQDLSELYIRSDLRQTLKGQEFLQYKLDYPVFMMLYSAEWQIELLKSVTTEDQLFLDGTFKVCPENISQMVTLLIKKREWNCSIPTAFVLLQDHKSETYMEMLQYIIRMAPSLRKVDGIVISVDFEQALHNAIRSKLPKAKIVGCEFHMKQAILRYIKKGNAGNELCNSFKSDSAERDELISRITRLIDTQTEDDFHKERSQFVEYYSMKQNYQKFLSYMKRNWLGSDNGKCAVFNDELWAKHSLPRFNIKMTNNMAEAFHKQVNAKFNNKPNLKRYIQLLQELEQDSYLKKKSLDNHTIINTPEESDESGSEVSTERSQKKRKRKQIVPPPSNLGKKQKSTKSKTNNASTQPSTSTSTSQSNIQQKTNVSEPDLSTIQVPKQHLHQLMNQGNSINAQQSTFGNIPFVNQE